MKIIVNDANILIDLIDIELLDAFFALPYDMNITDLVKDEFDDESFNQISPYVEKGVLLIHFFDQAAVENIMTLRSSHSAAMSLPDCSCLYLAHTMTATFLTGDKPLRSAANKLAVSVSHPIFNLTSL